MDEIFPGNSTDSEYFENALRIGVVGFCPKFAAVLWALLFSVSKVIEN